MVSERPADDHIERWRDPSVPMTDRVAALMSAMSLEEKVAQLYGAWIGAATEGDGVAPHQNELGETVSEELLRHGLGQFTRAFGTRPVDPAIGAVELLRTQRWLVANTRLGIPALVHEECLAGFTTWKAAAYPVPLAWGASFDPALVERMARRIGEAMRSVGVHQGLAPVLDVTVDPRWGRTEETIGEDPYLVGTIATAYVRGLESAEIVATLKHFAGYSASKAARNLAPVTMGPREFADVVLVPFEMAVADGRVRSVMHSYAAVDGVPAAADEQLLTGLLRDRWGFRGTVVADYFGVSFLKLLHGVAHTWGDAAALALRAGVDVELPAGKAYAGPLLEEVVAGRLDEAYVDRALERVLRQKGELGLLDAGWDAVPPALAGADLEDPDALVGRISLDTREDREIARQLAEESVVLLRNDGLLPLGAPRRLAVIGPTADAASSLLGCYSFPNHVGVHHPEIPAGIELPTLRDALTSRWPEATVGFERGCDVSGTDRTGIDAALRLARASDVVVLALGDRAGLFGGGTSGEGCDAESLALPGVQQELLERVLDAGTPVVVVLLSGRPYALGTAPERASAIVQTFFPGEEGAPTIAAVLAGDVNPSGRLPVSVPRHAGAQPSTYLAPRLARTSDVSNIDPAPAYPFGHGLGYTTFSWSDLRLDGQDEQMLTIPTDGEATISCHVENTGSREGTEIVQLYLHDPVASVVRPEERLVGYARVPLEPGASCRVAFTVPADAASFTGRDGRRVVEPGALELRLASASSEPRLVATIRLEGPSRVVDHTRRLVCVPAINPSLPLATPVSPER